MTAIVTTPGSAHRGRAAFLAEYRSLVDARSAIRSLELHGVDGDDLALVGNAADSNRLTFRQSLDRRMLSSVVLALAVGIAVGAVVGAVIGGIAMGIVALSWPDMSGAGWVSGLMIGWTAAAGALFGSLASVMRTLGFSESLPVTWEDDTGDPVWLAVYGERDKLRSGVEATHPVYIVDEPVATAHPDLVTAAK